jgi:hypothetical protein
MGTFDFIFKTDLGKLFRDGNIPKLYEKIYSMADSLSMHEMHNLKKEELGHFDIRRLAGEKILAQEQIDLLRKIFEFRNQRRDYHFHEMIKLYVFRMEKTESGKRDLPKSRRESFDEAFFR